MTVFVCLKLVLLCIQELWAKREGTQRTNKQHNLCSWLSPEGSRWSCVDLHNISDNEARKFTVSNVNYFRGTATLTWLFTASKLCKQDHHVWHSDNMEGTAWRAEHAGLDSKLATHRSAVQHSSKRCDFRSCSLTQWSVTKNTAAACKHGNISIGEPHPWCVLQLIFIDMLNMTIQLYTLLHQVGDWIEYFHFKLHEAGFANLSLKFPSLCGQTDYSQETRQSPLSAHILYSKMFPFRSLHSWRVKIASRWIHSSPSLPQVLF